MNIVSIIIGNACSLFAMGTDSLSASRKTVNSMLWIQNISQLLYGVGAVVLKGYSGAVQNVVCIIRNIAVIKGVSSKVVTWLLATMGVVLGFYFNNLGVMGLLPIIANLQYTLAVFLLKDNQKALRISFLISAFLFVFFSFAILNFVGVCTNLVVAGVTIASLIKTKSYKQ